VVSSFFIWVAPGLHAVASSISPNIRLCKLLDEGMSILDYSLLLCSQLLSDV